MPKRIAKIYVRLRGRTNTKHIDSIQYITRRSVMNALLNLNTRVIDMDETRINYVHKQAQVQARTDCLTKMVTPGKIQSRYWRNVIEFLKWAGVGEKVLSRLCELLIPIYIFISFLKQKLRLKKGNITLVVQKF